MAMEATYTEDRTLPVRFRLDPNNPSRSTGEALASLDAMTDAGITAARRIQAVRAKTGLSQAQFAAEYQINVGRLRDLEQGRTRPDSAILAYLTGIEREPDMVKRALSAQAG